MSSRTGKLISTIVRFRRFLGPGSAQFEASASVQPSTTYNLSVHELDPAQSRALLAEELTSEEVRDLLQRLNARDMGGSEHATVSAVVEATGFDVATVWRLLAEIRKEDFEERFGLRLDHHEKRIETLEERAHRLEKLNKPPVRQRIGANRSSITISRRLLIV